MKVCADDLEVDDSKYGRLLRLLIAVIKIKAAQAALAEIL